MPRYMDFAPVKKPGQTNSRASAHPNAQASTQMGHQASAQMSHQATMARQAVKTTSVRSTSARSTAKTTPVRPAIKTTSARPAAPRTTQTTSGAVHRAASPAVHSSVQATARPISHSATHPDTSSVAQASSRAAKPRGTRLASRLRRPAHEPEPIPDSLFDDENIVTPVSPQPVSDFADLEQLAEEIAEVTQTGPVVDSEDFSLDSVEDSFSLNPAPQFGVVENYQPKFVNTEVEKRPLSQGSNPPAAEISISETPDSIFGSFEDPETGESGVFSSTTDTFEDPTTGTAGSITTSAAIASGQDALVSAKSTRIRAHRFFRPVEKPVENSKNILGATSGAATIAATSAQVAGAVSGAATSAHAASALGSVSTLGTAASAAAHSTSAAAHSTSAAAHAATSATSAAAKTAKTLKSAPKSQMRIPRAQFINQNKIQKRPLSKNYYPENSKSAQSAKDDSPESVKVAPETKKSSKIGTFLAIIATIILGAVVGTVAFLLLPR